MADETKPKRARKKATTAEPEAAPADPPADPEPPAEGTELEVPVVTAAALAVAEARVTAELEAALTPEQRNQLTWGELRIHYPARDVSVACDGDTALRVMYHFALGRLPAALDALHPEVSSARRGWITLDTESPMGMTWLPHPRVPVTRTTVDPLPAAA